MVSSTISFIYDIQILCSFLFGLWPSSSFWFCRKSPGAFGCSSVSSCRYLSLYCTFPSLESHWNAAAIGLMCRLLGRGNLQSFLPQFVTTITRRSSRLTGLSDPAQALRLNNPITFKSLDSFHRSWHGAISTIWDTLLANLLLQGHVTRWCSVLKCLQHCCH